MAQRGRLQPEDENLIRLNYVFLLGELDGKDLVDTMYQENVFGLDDLDEVNNASPNTRKRRTEVFLEKILHSGVNGFKAFLKALDPAYSHVVKRLQETVPQQQNNTEDWFDKVPEDRQNKKISERDLMRVVQSLGLGWEIVGLEMGISQAQIDQCKMSNASSHMQIFAVLTKWQQKEAKNATFKALIKILRACEKMCTIDWEQVKTVFK